ncbi:hypothetical protein LMG19282_01452 [Cupriavidus campinensis]|uniref:hypothetical protein n=1 Tax=Cupriavidus campinensis TaxID=151783 RepID=UPI0016430F28|nr:hypothetical protein [Cupriavidus campinensis]CAG2138146.1 hypothetical protein LMG19282_01452 [Cupriavidus campinensis]
MNYKQKESSRREMLGCARIAAGAKKYGKPEEARQWSDAAAKHLFRLNGMAGNW